MSHPLWGYILDFLDINDPRPAREQFNERYQGGWLPIPVGRFDRERMVFTYPGDPPFAVLSTVVFRNELLHLLQSDFVIIEQADGSYEIARLD